LLSKNAIKIIELNPITPLMIDIIEIPSCGINSIKIVLLKIINIISFESDFTLYMKAYFNYVFFVLFLLISCGGSKSDVNDSYLSGSINQNTNLNQGSNNNQGNNTSNQTNPSYTFGNELIWSDEFDEDSSFGVPAVSPDKWNIETVAPNNGSWYNGELQYYTDKLDNIKVEDGVLKITAISESFQGKNYTSARINTQDKFEFTYGRVEMKAKLPDWKGMWPAFWMLGANIDEVSWPNCGELDILEHGDYVKDNTNNDPGLISSAVHYGPQDYSRQTTYVQNKIFFDTGQERFIRAEKIIDNPFEEFHTYAIQWAPDKIQFFVDEEMYFEYPMQSQHSPFDKPFFLLLNLAVGGHWTDGYVAPGFTNATYEIDYVRVYQ
jgi:beta-glucanase (GH16 family)